MRDCRDCRQIPPGINNIISWKIFFEKSKINTNQCELSRLRMHTYTLCIVVTCQVWVMYLRLNLTIYVIGMVCQGNNYIIDIEI